MVARGIPCCWWPVPREALDFAPPLTLGEAPAERAPVRLFVMGQEEWRDFESWPPRGYALRPFHLQAVRLCDVDEDGRSHSVCDGLTSISGTDEISKATVPDQQVVHDQTRPSMVILPVRAASGPTIY